MQHCLWAVAGAPALLFTFCPQDALQHFLLKNVYRVTLALCTHALFLHFKNEEEKRGISGNQCSPVSRW